MRVRGYRRKGKPVKSYLRRSATRFPHVRELVIPKKPRTMGDVFKARDAVRYA